MRLFQMTPQPSSYYKTSELICHLALLSLECDVSYICKYTFDKVLSSLKNKKISIIS